MNLLKKKLKEKKKKSKPTLIIRTESQLPADIVIINRFLIMVSIECFVYDLEMFNCFIHSFMHTFAN